jgi:hypothetical protein
MKTTGTTYQPKQYTQGGKPSVTGVSYQVESDKLI